MGDPNKWTVTYTKHIKQKRKVYQDGTLGVHGNKVLLYDDMGSVISSRFLKKEEVINCGQTLLFDGYLVDIGDSERNHEAHKDFTTQAKGIKKVDVGNTGASLDYRNVLKNMKKEDKRSGAYKFRTPLISLKAAKLNDGGSIQDKPQNFEATTSCSNPAQSAVREWHALYTTQLTQKSKKYHDGTIQLETSGSQVLLYDSRKMLLDSKFLKKGEVVRSGETMLFDGHLVEVGDPEGSSLSRTAGALKRADIAHGAGLVKASRARTGLEHDLKPNYGTSCVNKDSELVNLEAQEEKIREWHAMFTTQVTQKARKYHDGFLQLSICVSQRKQVILLDEEGTILSKKYLNSSEVVKTGLTLAVANYLVEIGDPKIPKGGEEISLDSSLERANLGAHPGRFTVGKIKPNPDDTRKRTAHHALVEENSSSATHAYSSRSNIGIPGDGGANGDPSGKRVGQYSNRLDVETIKLDASSATNNSMRHGGPKDDTSSGEHVLALSSSFSVDKMKFRNIATINKPMRDVGQILFTLKKPMASDNLAPATKPSVEQMFSSESADSLHFGSGEKLTGLNQHELKCASDTDAIEDNHGNISRYMKNLMGCYRSGISQSRVPQHLHTLTVDAVNRDHSNFVESSAANMPEFDPCNPDKRTVNSQGLAAESLDSKGVDLGFSEKSMLSPYSPIAPHQVSDVVVDLTEEGQAHNTSMGYAGLSGDGKLRESHVFRSLEGSRDKEIKSAEHVKNPNQHSADKLGTDTVDAALDSPNDAYNEAPEILKKIIEERLGIDEFPSFDLGF
ncbi:uncharacterized protein LOC113358428 isoform X2 [Papaver somniferum]|uniref:uncharacterized protein LOC113358428 isoform X2 n=1 Tax=Papaver somniferum TaxID=3469 RepID=UPI000E6FCD07|nr:uncharacterized protein LOC113358428 isoform X2 [Papaver somniferum]